jgi:putative transposase
MTLYLTRRVQLPRTEQLDALAAECGRLYSQTLVSFWLVVRKKGLWLKPSSLMRWQTSKQLHAHTADACVQAFFAALDAWRARHRQGDPQAHPPRRRKRFFRIEYKASAIRLRGGQLILSNGRGNRPIVLVWPWGQPQTVVIRWTGKTYEAIATYRVQPRGKPLGERIAGIDLGEVHPAVACDGERVLIANGRLLRSKRRYQNKLKGQLQRLLSRKKKGSHRLRRLVRSKQRQLKRVQHQIREIEHKQTSTLITTLHRAGVRRLVIGDVRGLCQRTDLGPYLNQKLHQWSSGQVRHFLTYKAQLLGIEVIVQDERYTSRTCPRCGTRRGTPVPGRVFWCPACQWWYHRDGVGAINIRAMYLGEQPPVVGEMAPPTGLRYHPQARVAR